MLWTQVQFLSSVGRRQRQQSPNGVGDLIPHSPRHHLTTHEIEELVAGYQAGSTAKELGDRWRVHRSTVAALLKARRV